MRDTSSGSGEEQRAFLEVDDAARPSSLLLEFQKVADTQRTHLLRAALHYCGCLELAEDAVQSGLLKAWLSLPTFREHSKLSTWVTRIVINEVFQMHRRNQPQRFVPLTLENQDHPSLDMPLSTPFSSPEADLLQRERSAILHSFVNGLPTKFRKAIRSCYLEERSVTDTAAALRLTEASVKTHLFRGRKALQQRLQHMRF